MLNLKKMILGANFAAIVIAKDLMIPNGKETIMGWSGESIDNISISQGIFHHTKNVLESFRVGD